MKRKLFIELFIEFNNLIANFFLFKNLKKKSDDTSV